MQRQKPLTSQDRKHLDCKQRRVCYYSHVVLPFCSLSEIEFMLPPPVDQRHRNPSRTFWEPPTRAILPGLPRKGANVPRLTASPAKEAEAVSLSWQTWKSNTVNIELSAQLVSHQLSSVFSPDLQNKVPSAAFLCESNCFTGLELRKMYFREKCFTGTVK